jgi:hypothetical protein
MLTMLVIAALVGIALTVDYRHRRVGAREVHERFEEARRAALIPGFQDSED